MIAAKNALIMKKKIIPENLSNIGSRLLSLASTGDVGASDLARNGRNEVKMEKENKKGISGKLAYIGSTSIVLIEKKGSRRLSIATVNTEATDIDTACKYPVDFQANARRIVDCCNGWDSLKQQRDDLLAACKGLSLIAQKIGITDDQPMRDKLASAIVEAEVAISAAKT